MQSAAANELSSSQRFHKFHLALLKNLLLD